MDKLLEPWTRSVIKGALQINDRLIDKGKSWEDVKAYYEESKNKIPDRALRTKPGRKNKHRLILKCPECDKPLNGSVVHQDSDKYSSGYRSYWLCGAACCPGKGCGYEIYSKLTISQIMERMRQTRESGGLKNVTTKHVLAV